LTPAMADTAARRCYAGDRRPVAVKQIAREEPEAHPEHVEGDGRAGGTMDRRVDGLCDHGGAIDGDGDFSVTVVDKRSNQLVIKHHKNKVKLEVH